MVASVKAIRTGAAVECVLRATAALTRVLSLAGGSARFLPRAWYWMVAMVVSLVAVLISILYLRYGIFQFGGWASLCAVSCSESVCRDVYTHY